MVSLVHYTFPESKFSCYRNILRRSPADLLSVRPIIERAFATGQIREELPQTTHKLIEELNVEINIATGYAIFSFYKLTMLLSVHAVVWNEAAQDSCWKTIYRVYREHLVPQIIVGQPLWKRLLLPIVPEPPMPPIVPWVATVPVLVPELTRSALSNISLSIATLLIKEGLEQWFRQTTIHTIANE